MRQDEPPTWALDTLGEDETIARLATGIKRFKLPDEQNFIKLYQQVARRSAAPTSRRLANSTRSAAWPTIFENRRQYPRAAEYWRQADRALQRRRAEAVSNSGSIRSSATGASSKASMTQPAGRGATVDFRFRNAKRRRVRRPRDRRPQAARRREGLSQVASPSSSTGRQMNISDIGYRLVQENQKKYVGAEVARWKLELEPRDKHFDKRITVTTPLQKAGAYLVTAKVAGGNTSQDRPLARRHGDRPQADAGQVVLLRRRRRHRRADRQGQRRVLRLPRKYSSIDGNSYVRNSTPSQNFAENTDENGQAFLPIPDDEGARSRVPMARHRHRRTTAGSRTSASTTSGAASTTTQQYNEVKTFAITDRPVYRPGQTVEFKVLDSPGAVRSTTTSRSSPTRRSQVEIHNPKGEKVYTETLTSDNYGGIAGKFELPADATLGQYSAARREPRRRLVPRRGVQEAGVRSHGRSADGAGACSAKKSRPRSARSTTSARRSPNATVKYKVLRSEHTRTLVSARCRGTGSTAPATGGSRTTTTGIPAGASGAAVRPAPWWCWRPAAPPEVVAEREVPIGADGTVEVEIDTSLAKAPHPDQDHRYAIQAEVVDQSRRTIVGSGEVLVARKPFEVFAWVDRGYYRVGDTIDASFAARRLDGKPVEGTGKLRLLKITYGRRRRSASRSKPKSAPGSSPPNAEGRAEIQLKASEKGQYRLSYRVTDKAGHEIEGGYLFTIIGEGFDGSEFRFNDLEIVPDKREYAPGRKSPAADQHEPRRLDGAALRAAGERRLPAAASAAARRQEHGRRQSASRRRTCRTSSSKRSRSPTAASTPKSARSTCRRRSGFSTSKSCRRPTSYKPGEHAKVKLKLTDEAGKPFVGSTVLSIFDKSVEYISGGSNVADIKEFFWKWRRQHRPYLETNLDRWFANLDAAGPERRWRASACSATRSPMIADELGRRRDQSAASGVGGRRQRASA